MNTPSHPDGRIVTRHEADLFFIGLDRPAKLNGFSPKMLRELAEAYTAYEQSDARCAVLYAEGRHFTAGLELDKLGPFMAAGNSVFPPGRIDPLNNVPPLRSKPVVAAVQGICFTIGVELMLAADVTVAARDCRFAQLEVKRGIMATGGATIRMVERAGWGNAMRYLLTGDEFGAATALRLGFVQEIVDPGDELSAATRIAQSIALQAPLAVQATLANARRAVLEGPDIAVAEFDRMQQRLLASEDSKEGVRSFTERREARFSGR